MHLIHDVAYKNADGAYHAVIEIPAGTNDKWTTDWDSGEIYHEQKDGKPRVIQFLAYPFNYGFIPQTYLGKAEGGDGDPLDVVLIAPQCPRASVQAVRVLGALELEERGEKDTKLISVLSEGMFSEITDLAALKSRYPGMLEMIHLWFDSYKGPGTFQFNGELSRESSETLIEQYHQGWLKANPKL